MIHLRSTYAALDQRDPQHSRALQTWQQLQREQTPLFSHNYVLLESNALLMRRLGARAVTVLEETIVPLLAISWVTPELHARAVAALLAANQRRLSLVDCVSFEVMRDLSITDAFTFDSDFTRQGFRTVP